MTSWSEGKCLRYNYNMGVAGKLLNDVLSWEGYLVDMNTISLLRFMVREAETVEQADVGRGSAMEERSQSDVNDVTRDVSEMAIDEH